MIFCGKETVSALRMSCECCLASVDLLLVVCCALQLCMTLEAMEVNAAEDSTDMPVQPKVRLTGKQAPPPVASFAAEKKYKKPSDFIRVLLKQLPKAERLNRRQSLFMVKFAKACDEAWADEQSEAEGGKPPKDRRVHHFLLLGAGGTGKTHVVQKVIFEAVAYIWPNESEGSPSMLVVASSNEQAKNISTARWRARTLHNAAGMRVQKMVNA